MRLAVVGFLAMAATGFASTGDLSALISKGGIVHVPIGKYILGAPVTLISGTHLDCDKGVIISDSSASKPLIMLLRIEGSNVSIDGCSFVVQSAMMIVTLASNSARVVISGNSFVGSRTTHGVLLDSPGLSDITISKNTFQGLAYGILQNFHAFDIHDVTIRGNSFASLAADGVELNNPVTNNCCGVHLNKTATNISIDQNTFFIPRPAGTDLNSGFCVGVAGAHSVRIRNNKCSAWNEGIHVEDRARDVLISGNSITTNDKGGHPYQSAITVIDGVNINIENNTISGAVSDGIHVDYDPHHQVQGLRVVNNNVKNCGDHGIYLGAGSLGAIKADVYNNSVMDCAMPMYLTGDLREIRIHDNSLRSIDGSCAVTFAPNVDRGRIEYLRNVHLSRVGAPTPVVEKNCLQ